MILWFRLALFSLIGLLILISGILFVKIGKARTQRIINYSNISIIDKKTNSVVTQSPLHSFYEPAADYSEKDEWMAPSKSPVIYTYNNDTLNDVRNYTIDKPQNSYRIIALGDSYTFGDHVNTADSWPKQLEDILNKQKPCQSYQSYEVINLGVRGYDIQDEVERYRIRGKKYHPDLVIWMLVDNDFNEINEFLEPLVEQKFWDLQLENKFTPKRRGAIDKSDSARLRLLPDAYDAARKLFHATYDQKTLTLLENQYFQIFTDTLYQDSLLFITFPFESEQYKETIKSWVQSRRFTAFTDRLPDITRDPSLSFMNYNDGHPTPLGHQMIAKSIYTYLRDNETIKCQ